MAASKCDICGKTAYPLESIKAIEKVFHKWCFKCADCCLVLNSKTFKGVEGKVWCSVHVPVDRASTAVGDFTVNSQVAAQKKNEDARSVQLAATKGTGDAFTQVADFTTSSQVAAQKKNEDARSAQLGATKGTGDAFTQVADFTTSSQMEAQQKNSEARSAQLATQKGTGEAPTGAMY